MSNKLIVSAAHYAPEFLDAAGTTKKVVDAIGLAKKQNSKLIAFPESFLPGFPTQIDFIVKLSFLSLSSQPSQLISNIKKLCQGLMLNNYANLKTRLTLHSKGSLQVSSPCMG